MAISATINCLRYLRLLLGTVLSVCFLAAPNAWCGSDSCSVVSIDSHLAEAITFEHNYYRSIVDPPARNMMRMYWSEEMVRIATENACNCRHFPTGAPPTRLNAERRWARENHGIHAFPVKDPSVAVFNIIERWFREGERYDFTKKGKGTCTTTACEHYVHMVWAAAYEVGCALSVCSIDDVSSYLLVCAYGPNFPRNLLLPLKSRRRPYRRGGTACSRCRDGFEECGYIDPPTGVDIGTTPGRRATEPITNLCYSRRGTEACFGSDPHFAIRLPGGNLLCYTFQGLQNTTFNLIANDQLVMNAHFVPDTTTWDNTWLGSIGIAVLHEGRKIITLQFTAADQFVKIGNRNFDARTVEKLTLSKGRLTVVEALSVNHSLVNPTVGVEFTDSRLDFNVRFNRNNHLDVYWHNAGAVSENNSEGIVGQFFHDGVSIDVKAQLLHLPGRLPVPVEKKHLWKFMEQSLHRDSMCWISAYHTNQGAGIVAGTYKDYIVNDLISTEHLTAL